jgi:uncharacterized membrane protein YccC
MSAPSIAPVGVITAQTVRRRRANPIDSLLSLLVEELEPNPRRLKTTMRMALIGTVGAALMASCHVFNQLGTYLVWIMIGPVAMMSPRKAVTCLAIIAPLLIASVQVAGMLVEAPWLLLLFLFLFTASTTYLNVALKLGAFGLIIQVVTIDTFYSVVFTPSDFGWHTAALYGGCVIAFGLITLFDNWIWPDPAELILPEAIAASVARNRARFVAVANYYLAKHGSKKPPEPPFTSGMPAQIALLERARDEGVSEHRRGILLAAISREERLHIQIDRMTVAVREDAPTEIRTIFRAEIEAAISAIAIALDELEHDVVTSIRTGPDNPASPAAVRARATLDAMDARIVELRPTFISRIGATEAANFGAFTESMHEMVRLIERPLDTPPLAIAAATSPTEAVPMRTMDPALIRYSAKVGLCLVIGYIVGLTTQQPGLSTILTTVIVTALPTYGASMRKMILRIVGAVIGGIITVIAIMIVTPNFRTLPSYLIVTFVVLAISAYASLSSGRVAYAGKQIATTFLLVFAGLSPSANIYGPLWRIWGTFLGTVVVTIVFILVKPEYAGNSLLLRLRKVLRDALDLAPKDETIPSMATINGMNTESMHLLSEILEVAEDARIEGGGSQIDHESVVQASGTLRRITNRFAALAAERTTAPLPRLDETTQKSRDAIYTALRTRLESWLTFYEGAHCLNRASAMALAAQHSRTDISQPLEEFGALLGANGFARITPWSLEQRRQILAELQSLGRLEFLTAELDTHLSHLPSIATGSATSRVQISA